MTEKETELVKWLHSKDVDCSETGQVHTQFGNQFNIVDLISELFLQNLKVPTVK